MRNDKIRRFRPRSNKFRSRRPNNGMVNNGAIHNGIGIKNNLHRNPQNLERVIEKYKNLAKEALSAGDKILHENYLQHSDHFSRILSDLNLQKANNTSKDSQNEEDSTNIANK